MAGSDHSSQSSPDRLVSVQFDNSLGPAFSPDMEHERRVAVFDLLSDNSFTVTGSNAGPFHLQLSLADGRLIFDVQNCDRERCCLVGLSISPFRRIVKDYFMICESYFAAIRTATPSQIETIDMARRSLHNEGSNVLIERLKGKIELDLDTSRRLFTLVCALHWRG